MPRPTPNAFRPTPRSKVRRLPKRGHYDRATVHAVLDAGVICHVGYVIDGQPYVTPTAYWRHGDRLYWHGSAASRMLRHLAPGAPACVTVTHLDGFVLARSGFHHSINFRSAMAFGTARLVADEAEKAAALEAFMDRLWPGRWREVRGPNRKEMKATAMVVLTIEEASVKIRTGPPIDDEADYALPCWAGVLPVRTVAGEVIADPRLAARTKRPKYLSPFAAGADLGAALGALARPRR